MKHLYMIVLYIIYMVFVYRLAHRAPEDAGIGFFIFFVLLPQLGILIWRFRSTLTAAEEYGEEIADDFKDRLAHILILSQPVTGRLRVSNLNIRAGLIKAGEYPVRAVSGRSAP